MRLRKTQASIQDRRLFSGREGADYVGLGIVSFKAWAKKIGAEKRIGARVLYDKTVIDREVDKIGGQ